MHLVSQILNTSAERVYLNKLDCNSSGDFMSLRDCFLWP